MTQIFPSRLLRAALLIDAFGSAGCGLLQLGLYTHSARLGLPVDLVLGSGLFMLSYAAVLVLLARMARVPRAAIVFIAVGNLGWALGCGLLALWAPAVTALGAGYLVFQAVAVAGFAALQSLGLARSNTAQLAAAGA